MRKLLNIPKSLILAFFISIFSFAAIKSNSVHTSLNSTQLPPTVKKSPSKKTTSPGLINSTSPDITKNNTSSLKVTSIIDEIHDFEQTISITPTRIPSMPPTYSFPDEYYITNISGHRQFFPLGCEASVAVDWAVFFNVYINEYEFQHKLPLSDNPDKGFVGGVNGPWGQAPPFSYGVHAEPIAKLLREYGLNAKSVKGFTIEQLKTHVANDKPVIAWVIGNCIAGVPYEYTDPNGITTTVAAYEHVVIVTGYDEVSIRYLNNGIFFNTPTDNFLNSWSVLGNMVVINSE